MEYSTVIFATDAKVVSAEQLIKELYAAEAGELKSKWTFATAWEDGVAARFKTWQLEGTKLQVRYMEASTEPYTEADVLHVLADSEDDDEDD